MKTEFLIRFNDLKEKKNPATDRFDSDTEQFENESNTNR